MSQPLNPFWQVAKCLEQQRKTNNGTGQFCADLENLYRESILAADLLIDCSLLFFFFSLRVALLSRLTAAAGVHQCPACLHWVLRPHRRRPNAPDTKRYSSAIWRTDHSITLLLLQDKMRSNKPLFSEIKHQNTILIFVLNFSSIQTPKLFSEGNSAWKIIENES